MTTKDPEFDTSIPDQLLAAETGETIILRHSAELLNVEQPVDLNNLFYELHALAWDLENECMAFNDVISMMQDKKAAKEEEYAPRMKELEEDIKAEILKQQKPFKCDYGAATFRKAYERTSWDSKKLEGLALVLPQIKECKSVSKVEAGVTLMVGYQV